MEQLLNQGIFEPKATPEQTAALERLETLLALIEGWVQTVVADALGDRIPGTSALSETLRRRRATGGPAEQTFATLVGLELRPRKLREAAVLWERLTQAVGADARDAVWQHPDLLPSAEDLDEPAGFIDRMIGGDTSGIDKAIADLQKGPTTGRRPRMTQLSARRISPSAVSPIDEPNGSTRREEKTCQPSNPIRALQTTSIGDDGMSFGFASARSSHGRRAVVCRPPADGPLTADEVAERESSAPGTTFRLMRALRCDRTAHRRCRRVDSTARPCWIRCAADAPRSLRESRPWR